MFGIVFKSLKEAAEEHGCLTAIIAGIILLVIVFGILCGVIGVLMALWNGCLIALFPMIPEISFWQMWGIYLLCDILFKSTVYNKE